MILQIARNGFAGALGRPLGPAGADPGFDAVPDGRPFPAEEAEARAGILRQGGAGALRLGLPLDCIEGPAPGTWNEAWLAYIRKFLAALEDADIAVFPVLVLRPPVDENGLAGRIITASRHACRRFKNCRAIAAWGILGGKGPWPAWTPAESAAFAGECREKIREVYPEALFFMERWPDGDAAACARSLDLVPPALITALFDPA